MDLEKTAISWPAILLLILAPNLSALAQLALSRTREYDADLNAPRLTGGPEGLARALAKIESEQGGWLERIFMPGRRIPDPSLLRTHPQTDRRIARLLALRPLPAGFDRELLARPTSDIASAFGRPVVRLPGWPPIPEIRAKSVTIKRNRRSRSFGMGGHDDPEYAALSFC